VPDFCCSKSLLCPLDNRINDPRIFGRRIQPGGCLPIAGLNRFFPHAASPTTMRILTASLTGIFLHLFRLAQNQSLSIFDDLDLNLQSW
jgi:hypothetical protein